MAAKRIDMKEITPKNDSKKTRKPLKIQEKSRKPLVLRDFLLWRRVRDSNPCGCSPNGFQDRPVMTTSVTLHILLVKRRREISASFGGEDGI